MALFDQILILASVLLWLNWRSHQSDPLGEATPNSLAATLRPADSRRFPGWQFLIAVVLLLLLRAVIYFQIGPSAEWTPKIDLMFVVPAFRSDNFNLCLLYSLLSFGRTLLVLYFWLLAVTIVNRGSADPGPIQKLIRHQLGPVARWPWPVQALLPFLLTALIWMALHPLLFKLRIITGPQSFLHLVEQGFLIGAGLLFSLKFLIPFLLLVHLLATYVYLGSNPVWEFISGTAQNLLRPLRWLPLRLGRLDFTPAIGALLALLLLHFLPELGLRTMLDRNYVVWPQ
jgi:uncharacterized protein YggT (Ycf19 family)